MVPKDEDELADMLFTAMKWNGPIAVRFPRGLGPGTPVKDVPRAIAVGKAELLQHGDHDRVVMPSSHSARLFRWQKKSPANWKAKVSAPR